MGQILTEFGFLSDRPEKEEEVEDEEEAAIWLVTDSLK